MFIRGRRVAAGLLVLTGLAGCSGSGPAAAPATTAAAAPNISALWHEFVQCARTHGVPNLAEPSVDASGEAHFPPGAEPSGAPPASVLTGCRSIIDRIEAVRPGATDDGNPADVPKLIEFAKCMRANGIPHFPDPLADGTFPNNFPPEVSKTNPVYRRASQTCEHLNPDPNGQIHVH
jgi:hypothetical protein